METKIVTRSETIVREEKTETNKPVIKPAKQLISVRKFVFLLLLTVSFVCYLFLDNI